VVAYVAFEPGNLDQLYVVPGHQGEGIGSALVQLAKDRVGPPLRLWAFQRNRAARGFYERRGFRAVTLTDGENNDEREPDVSYEWTG
jgi:putative acetyltransferase